MLNILKFLFAVIVLMPLTYNASSAQNRNVVKLDLISPFTGGIQLSFERALNERRSFQITSSFVSKGAAGYNTTRAFAIQPEYRFYVSNWVEAPTGVFVGPSLSYMNAKQSYFGNLATISMNALGAGASIGYQHIIRERISLEGSLLPMYYTAIGSGGGTYGSYFETVKISGLALGLSLNVGIAF
jgi:hypothetical protein